MADKHVNRENMNASLDHLNPTQQQSEKMWQRLSAAMEERENPSEETTCGAAEKTVDIEHARKKAKKKKGTAYRVMQVAAALTVMLVLGAAVDGMTGGNVYAAIKEFLHIGQTRQDIVGNIKDIQGRNTAVYAPEIFYCDGETLIFGTIRGLIVYDMAQKKVAATIDTQKIDCVYFNSDSKHTRVVKEEQSLIVFNMIGEEAEGNYYVFDLTQVNGGQLAVSQTGSDAEGLKAYVDAWKEHDAGYVDTFDYFSEHTVVSELFAREKDTELMYSQRSIVWMSEGDRLHNCFIFVQNGEYYLGVCDYENQAFSEVKMNLDETIATEEGGHSEELPGEENAQSTEQTLPATLPEFIYMGDNKAIAAIWEYHKTDVTAMYGGGEQVFIPGYIIYKEVQTEDELLVFGNFWSYGFQLTGNVLENASGGEMPACFHLKETADGYEVVGVDVTGDGGMYDDGIREFTKDYPEVYEMYFSGDPDARENAMTEYVSMYVSGNNLDIKYVKEYGWDPIPLFR